MGGYAALPAGSLLVSLTSGWTGRVHRQGRAIVLAAAGWGLAIAAAGQLRQVWAVLLLLTLAGAFDMVSGIFRSAMWNQTIPDELRGRLAGIELLSYSSGPQLGQVRVGGMAALMGVRAAVSAGGLLCFAGVGLLALGLPKLRAYDARTDEHARRMRERRTSAAATPANGRTGDGADARAAAQGRPGADAQDTDPAPVRGGTGPGGPSPAARPLPAYASSPPPLPCSALLSCHFGSVSHSRFRSRAVSMACEASSRVSYGPKRSAARHSGPSSTVWCLRQ